MEFRDKSQELCRGPYEGLSLILSISRTRGSVWRYIDDVELPTLYQTSPTYSTVLTTKLTDNERRRLEWKACDFIRSYSSPYVVELHLSKRASLPLPEVGKGCLMEHDNQITHEDTQIEHMDEATAYCFWNSIHLLRISPLNLVR